MTVSLTVSDLFTPSPSGVGAFGNVPNVPASGTWLAVMLNIAQTVGLPTTSWQSGAPERTILAIEAVCFAQSDADISVMAQGAFLDSAASGTVTYTTSNGTTVTIPVTPDPSIPSQNPTGALGWLDLTGQNVYDQTRLPATYVSGPLAIVNVSTSTVGPYVAGNYHVANVGTGQTYNNQDALTIPSSIIGGSGGVVSGVAVGLASSIVSTQAPHGLAPGNAVYILIPPTSGISGLNGVFALISSVTSNTFAVPLGSSGAWTASGQVYLCTVASMVADVLGTSSNAAPGAVAATVTQATGVSVSNVVAWSGANWESNTAYAARCRLSLAAASPNGPSQAYEYWALTAQQYLAAATPSYTFTNGPIIAANSYANPQTGIVTTVVASATPASTTLGANVTPGCAQNPVLGATNASPIVITTQNAHGLISGNSATVTGVLGNAAANGTNAATVLSATTYSIPVAGNGAYTGGGSVEGGDLGAVDALLQQNVTPDTAIAITVSAQAFPVAILATVIVPQANVAAYTLAVKSALQAYLFSLPLGGFSGVGGGVVPYDGIVGVLEDVGVIVLGTTTYVRNIQGLTVNGSGVDVAFPTNAYQALLSGASAITVVGV